MADPNPKIRVALFLTFLFICLIILIDGSPVWAESASEPRSRYGGTLVLAAGSDPKSFNDIIAKETSTTLVTSLIFEGLTRMNVFTLEPEPNLAERWEVDESGLQWTFFLRRDVRWSDGQPFTSDDVLFTFNDLIFNDQIPSSARDIFTIEGEPFEVVKLDDFTVRFILPKKFAPFLMSLGQAILPRHKLRDAVANNEFNFTWGIDTPPQEIVGTGPFRLVRYQPGERLVFERNPQYWKQSVDGGRLPYIHKLIYLIIPSRDAMILRFLEDEIDYVDLRGKDYPLLKPLEAGKNFRIYDVGPNFGSQFVVFNQNRGQDPKTARPIVDPNKLRWFTDVRFRRAVAHAVDKERIIGILMNGLGDPQHGPMSPASGYFYNPDVAQYEYDLEQAAALLKQAGFADRDHNGVIEDKQGNEVRFNLYTNSGNDARVQIAAILRHDLQRLGMAVNFLQVEFNTLVSKLNSTFDWDAVVLGLTGGIEPHFGRNVWHSSGQLHMWYPRQGQPATDWEARIDAIFDAGVQELDRSQRKVLYDEWQAIVARELPFIYTVLERNIFAVRNKFGNLRPNSYGGAFHNLEEIYIIEKP